MSGTGIYDAASLRWAADVDWGPLQEFLGVDEGPSEKELVLDALFALGGVDGKFLYLDNERQVYDIDDSFNVAPWNRKLLQEICQAGVYFRNINAWMDPILKNADGAASTSFVLQALCTALQMELGEYSRKLASLQTMAESSVIPMDRGRWQETQGRLQCGDEKELQAWLDTHKGFPLTLDRLLPEMRDWNHIMKDLGLLVEALKGKTGGALLEAVYRETNEGDAAVLGLKRRLLRQSLGPLRGSALDWLRRGSLDSADPDFFVCWTPEGRAHAERERERGRGRERPIDLWHHGFQFLPKQVPGSVVPMALAAAVFQTGKSVHFLLHACEDKAVASQLAGEAADSALREHRESRQGEYDADMAAWEWPPSDVKALAKVQARVSSQVEGRLLMLMTTRFALMQHCFLLKQYVLLGRGDFAQAFVSGASTELDKQAKKVSDNVIAGALEAAVRLSSPTPEETVHLHRLRTRFLQIPEDKLRCVGWQVLYLDYVVDAPLNAVVTRECKDLYREASRLFLRMRQALVLLDAAGNCLAYAHARAQRMLSASRAAAATSGAPGGALGPLPSQRRGSGALGGGPGPGTSGVSSLRQPLASEPGTGYGGLGPTGAGAAHRISRGAGLGSEGALAAHVQSAGAAARPADKWEAPLRLAGYLCRCLSRTLQGVHEFLMLGVVASAWHHFQQDVESAASLEDVVVAHRRYLGAIQLQSFLGDTREHKAVQQSLGDLFAIADRFNNTANTLRGKLDTASLHRRSGSIPKDRLGEGLEVDEGDVSAMESCKRMSVDLAKCHLALGKRLGACRAQLRSTQRDSNAVVPTEPLDNLLEEFKRGGAAMHNLITRLRPLE